MNQAIASATVTKFFDAYRAQDVEGMVDLCDERAGFHYTPVEFWGRQRVVRGDGKVGTIGKVFWTGLIDAFPDLTNKVNSITADPDGNVAAEVVISGTQAKDFGNIGNQGKHFDLPHLFVLHVNGEARIDNITAYWDGSHMNRELGRIEID
jgi:ketosteroid isomerase-like protein